MNPPLGSRHSSASICRVSYDNPIDFDPLPELIDDDRRRAFDD